MGHREKQVKGYLAEMIGWDSCSYTPGRQEGGKEQDKYTVPRVKVQSEIPRCGNDAVKSSMEALGSYSSTDVGREKRSTFTRSEKGNP